jgi:hypothetical protein
LFALELVNEFGQMPKVLDAVGHSSRAAPADGAASNPADSTPATSDARPTSLVFAVSECILVMSSLNLIVITVPVLRVGRWLVV